MILITFSTRLPFLIVLQPRGCENGRGVKLDLKELFLYFSTSKRTNTHTNTLLSSAFLFLSWCRPIDRQSNLKVMRAG